MDMIDIHCHLIPKVDDGAENFRMTQKMLYKSADDGVKAMAIYDTMKYIKCDVSTICVGMAASMATAMISAITNTKIRANVAMTGEITLRGRVLPIGGLKEKLLAAKNAGIKTVLVPVKNKRDVADVSSEITRGMEIKYVETMEEVLASALVKEQAGESWVRTTKNRVWMSHRERSHEQIRHHSQNANIMRAGENTDLPDSVQIAVKRTDEIIVPPSRASPPFAKHIKKLG